MCKVKRTAAFLTAAAVMASGLAFLNKNSPDMTALALEAGQVANPIIYSDVPDPDIIRVGDTYYMVSTTMYFNPGAPIMKSKDLVSWEICNYVYDTYHDSNKQNLVGGEHDYSHGSWAASLRYNKGTFYVFFGSYGSGKSYIYKTTDIENGKWTRSEINGMYHDASMLFDDDGRNYLVFGGGGEIKIKELNSEMTGFANGAQERTIFKTGLSGLSGEGAHIQKINGYYYVFIIAWPSGSGRIELCYRSKSLNGPFEGKTILDSGIGTYGSGVAQGGIVQTPDGDWYGLLFQDHGAIGRIPALVPVTWQDDWPIMGVNGKCPVVLNIPGGHTGTSLAKDDDFTYSSNKLKLEWQWNHNPDSKYWSVTDRPGWLRLTNGYTSKSIVQARNTLTMRTEGPSCSGIIKMDVSHMKPGDCAGLSAFQYNYGNVGVRVTDSGEKKIYMASNGGYGGDNVMDSYDKIEEEVAFSGDTVYLKTDFKFNNVGSDYSLSNNIDKVNFYYSTDGSNWNKIGKEIGMTYDLKFFTGYRNAIYSYGTKSTGGYVDIDYFDYDRAEWNAPTVVEPDADGYWFHDTFEGSTGGWSGRGGASVATSGRSPYSGAEALLVSDRKAAWNGAQKPLSTAIFKPGEEYAFSVCFQNLEGADQVEYKLTLQYDAGGETHFDMIAQEFAYQGEYVQLYNPNYRIPEGASNLYLIAETTEELCNYYIDEAIAAPAGTEIDGPASNVIPATKIKGDLDFDSKITVADLVLLKSGIIEGFSSKSAQTNGDTDQNGTVDAADVILLQEYLFGMISEFTEKN
ncbi:MAG: family 43 glycosylhydrolase [Oscillospiraceae bacterium]|nr:family 43 glycosylhydrolase [Oscillospiraceae bacterium]